MRERERVIEMPGHGSFLWNELVTSDRERCGDFYCRLLGWTRRDVDAGPFGTYTIFQREGRDIAGMMGPTTEYSRSRPSCWNAYIEVADVDACASRIEELGGRIIEPPGDVPGVGRICMAADPAGAVVLLMKPAGE